MIFDYMRKRNPGVPVPDKKPEQGTPPPNYVSNPNAAYRDNAKRTRPQSWWLPRALRFIADCLESEDE